MQGQPVCPVGHRTSLNQATGKCDEATFANSILGLLLARFPAVLCPVRDDRERPSGRGGRRFHYVGSIPSRDIEVKFAWPERTMGRESLIPAFAGMTAIRGGHRAPAFADCPFSRPQDGRRWPTGRMRAASARNAFPVELEPVNKCT